MPIDNVQQPDILPVDSGLLLREFDESILFALPWYLDLDTVFLVDGVRHPMMPKN